MDLDYLKAALNPIGQIGRLTDTFAVGDLMVTIRTLEPAEEREVQRFARDAVPDISDQLSITEYLDNFKTMSLAYSLVQVNSLDFKGVEFIETGEVLENGVKVKIRKHEALFKIITPWSKSLTTAIFRRFGELMIKSEEMAEKAVTFDPSDTDAEIARLQSKIEKLQQLKVKTEAMSDDIRSTAIDYVMQDGKTQPTKPPSQEPQEVIAEDPPQGPLRTLSEHADPMPASSRQTSVPMTAPPPVPGEVPASVQVPAAPPPQEDPRRRIPLDFDSSFVDMSDPESATAAMEAENQRLLAMRQRAQQATVVAPPPHLAARQAQDVAPRSDVPVLTPPPQPTARASVPSTVNPNFRPPQR